MLRTIRDFLYFVAIVFLAMIVGWFIIGFLETKFSGNLVGKSARAVASAADPQG